jgi:iron complex outermembrane recepter protein
MHKISGRIRCASIGFHLAAIFWCAGARAQAQILVHFDLPAQSLAKSLKAIGTATNTDVGFSANQVAGFVAPALEADLTVDGALMRVLVGTGLRPQHLDDHTIVIATLESSTADSAEKKALPANSSTPVGQPVEFPQTIHVVNSSSPLLLAQTDKSGPDNAADSEHKEDRNSAAQLGEVVVTGTHIAGSAPVGSPIITLTAIDIQNSGYSTIGDVIRSVPQAFGGGVNPGVVGTTAINTNQNVSSASTVNLRGLGSDSTLTLVDGHRLAFDGYTSSFDISAIPLAAIERVEIMTDSASSIYGSDAVAGVANFILKKNYEGAETGFRAGEASGGDAKEYQVTQLLGTNWSRGNVLLSYEHYRQDALYASDRSFSNGAPGPLSLLPDQVRDSVFARVGERFSDNISAYAETLFSNRKAETVSTYPGYASLYEDNTTRLFAVMSGVSVKVGNAWIASLDGTSSQTRDDSSVDTVIPNSPAQVTPSFYANRANSIEGTMAGPVVELPSGPIQAAIGSGYRTETYHDPSQSLILRHLAFEYGEIKIPAVRTDSTRLGLERLEFSISGRHEHYSDIGTANTPKAGFIYVPIRDLTLRGTWGKAFRAPDLQLEYGQRQVIVLPAAPFGVTSPADAQMLLQYGSNASLRPETARLWTTGLDYSPEWESHLKASVTYFNIDYRDRITAPINDELGALVNPLYTPFVTHNPSPATQAALIGQSNYYVNDSGADYDPTKVVAILMGQYQNATMQQAHGVDLTVDYRLQASIGEFDLSANAAWLTLTEMNTSTSPTTLLSGTVFNPTKFKSRLGLTWQNRGWSAASAINYVGREADNVSDPIVAVSSWTTVDAQLAYELSGWGGVWRGFHVSVAAQNLLNRAPPKLSGASTSIFAVGYDSTNASPLGRAVSLNVRKDW